VDGVGRGILENEDARRELDTGLDELEDATLARDKGGVVEELLLAMQAEAGQ
jgi:hypothetical protein